MVSTVEGEFGTKEKTLTQHNGVKEKTAGQISMFRCRERDNRRCRRRVDSEVEKEEKKKKKKKKRREGKR